jgi:hypothetical protein
LGNYSFQSSYHLQMPQQTDSLQVTGDYHDKGDFQLTGYLPGGSGTQQMVLIHAANDYYAGAPGSGFVDLGASLRQNSGGSGGQGNANPTAQVSHALDAYNGAWTALLSTSGGKYAGPCLVVGRPGNSFQLNISLFGLASLLGLGKIGGTACLDTATNAPLSVGIAWHQQGGSSSLDAHFLITGVNDVPFIPAPAGAVPLSSLNQQGGAGVPNLPSLPGQ